MSAQPLSRLTAEQYLEIERAAEFRSEFVAGEMFAMSGGTLNHARLVGAALISLGNQLKGSPCEAAANDLRLYIERSGVFTYPDIAVICGPPKFKDSRRDTITDVTLIIEVLSPSTRNYDRGEKFEYYRGLASFSEYILIRQDRTAIEHHIRQPDHSWLFREVIGPGSFVDLKSVKCRLALDDLYERVVFEP